MKKLLSLVGIIFIISLNAQIYGDYYLNGYSIDDEFFPTPENEELPFVITEFGSDWNGEDYLYKMTSICGMRLYEVEYLQNSDLKIIGIGEMENNNCTQSENQIFQTAYFNLFPNNAVFSIVYIDFEDGGAIELVREDEAGQEIRVLYSTDLDSEEAYNPIQNLQWDQWYVSPENYFILSWEEPQLPHAELLGYNVYRENELYRFQTETALYNLLDESNADIDFLIYPEENPMPFTAHVKALYEGGIESNYIQTVFIKGPALSTIDVEKPSVLVYPNPTKDILQFSEILKNIKVYDVTGKTVQMHKNSTSKLFVSKLPKGTYILFGAKLSGEAVQLKFVKK